MPFSSLADTVDPVSDCPKKDRGLQEDSVSISESDDSGLEEVQLQQIPDNDKKPVPVAEKAPEKTNYESIDNNLDKSDEVVEGDPNSAMSFNFIYYIIDKFKFTDPLE
jgi:hypothetical protein